MGDGQGRAGGRGTGAFTRRAVLAGLGSALVVSPSPAAKPEAWSVYCDENFPPYSFFDRGRYTGMDTEIVDAVLSRIGVEAHRFPVPWSRAIASLEGGVADMAYQLVGRPDRFERFAMVGPLRTGLTVFAGLPDGPGDIRSLEDLAGLTVGTVKGFSYMPEFDNATHFTRDPAASAELSLRKLVGRRVDLVIGDRLALGWLARQEGLEGLIRFLPTPVREVPRYAAFPKDRADKAERFRRGLGELRADGTVDAIISRWQALG